jgi:hypothetical protein
MELPFTMEPISMFLSDARSTPIDSDSIDLVVTSPPYINVFNYHQQYRASLEYLQYDLLRVAKSEIGSNRKHRGNRFLTVIQYCLDIALVFAELFRIGRSEGRIIFIVGRESTIRGTRFYNGEIVAEIVHRVFDIELISRQERSFKNRFGQDIYEDILHFPCHKINMSENTIIAKAEEVAGLVIENAIDAITNDTVKEDIISALEKLGSIYPSPLMNEDTVRDLV